MIHVRLIRHADAESRASHTGPDTGRPLSARGRREAAALALHIDDATAAAITSVWASPAVRCTDTVQPLADRCGQPVGVDERLAEGSSVSAILILLGELTGDAVLCSHGDVIGDTVHALVGRGLVLTGDAEWAKASTWVLDVADGTIVAARYEPPLPP